MSYKEIGCGPSELEGKGTLLPRNVGPARHPYFGFSALRCLGTPDRRYGCPTVRGVIGALDHWCAGAMDHRPRGAESPRAQGADGPGSAGRVGAEEPGDRGAEGRLHLGSEEPEHHRAWAPRSLGSEVLRYRGTLGRWRGCSTGQRGIEASVPQHLGADDRVNDGTEVPMDIGTQGPRCRGPYGPRIGTPKEPGFRRTDGLKGPMAILGTQHGRAGGGNRWGLCRSRVWLWGRSSRPSG